MYRMAIILSKLPHIHIKLVIFTRMAHHTKRFWPNYNVYMLRCYCVKKICMLMQSVVCYELPMDIKWSFDAACRDSTLPRKSHRELFHRPLTWKFTWKWKLGNSEAVFWSRNSIFYQSETIFINVIDLIRANVKFVAVRYFQKVDFHGFQPIFHNWAGRIVLNHPKLI